jgi:hypothetical protein
VATLDGAGIAALLGEEGARKFRAHDAAQVRARTPGGQFAPKAAPAAQNGSAPKERVHVDTWLKDRW